MSLADLTEHRLWATAIHEAGHAVIARVLGFPCGTVEIGADGQAGGLAVIADPETALESWHRIGKAHRSLEAAQRAKVISYMAGASAEEECIGRSRDGHFDDLLAAAKLVLSLVADEANDAGGLAEGERYQQRLRRMTARLVHRHRQKIEALARALLQQRKMTDDRVRSVTGLPVAFGTVPKCAAGGHAKG